MQLIVGQTGHNIQFEKPQVVTDAILEVVQRVRAFFMVIARPRVHTAPILYQSIGTCMAPISLQWTGPGERSRASIV